MTGPERDETAIGADTSCLVSPFQIFKKSYSNHLPSGKGTVRRNRNTI